ncbi:FtsK/SpoIIIE domain-containing protein [Streptomyces sp. NPDC051569]|uniref:FtsK/SpoIIIE domain-containing protein n=1 Tax=Streptomyces sp. NPDC051569 TaxID=3365661 RepID=UPI00379DC690
MQIRLTVLAPRGGHAARRACDVLVTAPAGTALAAVASGLATAAAGPDASGTVVLYSGRERLDAQRCALGEPPLIDGAVLSLQVPGPDDIPTEDAPAQLHVVAGPDAGGVHLLHGGKIRIGRSAEADVPLDDPDVSRLHCAVTVGEDGRVSVADLSSTNGTTLEGVAVGDRPVRLAPGALLRLGESALRLTTGARPAVLATTPDGEGHLRIGRPGADRPGALPHAGESGDGAPGTAFGALGARPGPVAAGEAPDRGESRQGRPYGAGSPDLAPRAPATPATPSRPSRPSRPNTPTTRYDAAPDSPRVPGARGTDETRPGLRAPVPATPDTTHSRTAALDPADGADGAQPHSRTLRTAARAPEPPEDDSAPRRGGIGAWARRLTGGREDEIPEAVPGGSPADAAATEGRAARPDIWPDPAAVLLTALCPGPRLWERDSRHAEALVIRLGTADGPASGGPGPLRSAPVTVGLREAGSLGLAGPRERLTGLTRAAVAQLAALHSPADLEIVLISTDRARSPEQRGQEWKWLGWLPHVRPAHGQDCRLLLAYDRDQAGARTAELTRRLDEGPLGPGWASADAGAVAAAAAHHDGPYTVVIVDGDPGSAALRETTARLAGAGAAAGIHLICLAETPAASPLSPVAATYEAACAASLPFRECGAVALLSGDVATALRLLRTTVGQSAGHGTVAVVDAVSPAWAERFARALAPLRTSAGGGQGRPAAALPRSSRLLDELGLARATPASLLARWASAADRSGTGSCTVVLGAGPRGPLSVDLTQEGPHLLIEGPAGSGRTELLRSVAASLAAADRPDRLGLLLVDGAGGERGDGLAACTELPHVTEHLIASDPVRMRQFAQALGAELKRRSELLGRLDFAEWHIRQEVSERMIGQRPPSVTEQRTGRHRADQPRPDQPRPDRPADSLPGLRSAGGRAGREQDHVHLPRLVVLVDDFDALTAPALGSPGRPAAGSVVRALEAVAREGERLGVHLVATSGRPDRTVDTELAQGARLRIVLDAPPAAPAPDDPAPGRGRLGHPDNRVTPFQAGRVTGRIPRTATQRPTVVPLEWERMGDPPARRPVRELGNGPTDLALLASALERAARSVDAVPLAPLTPAHP